MRTARPRSLTGLLLIGFTLVTVPLIVAAIGATMQMRRLVQQSETLVLHGMEATRHSQELFRETTAMERTARLYQVLGDVKLKSVLAEHHAGFERSLNALAIFVPDKDT